MWKVLACLLLAPLLLQANKHDRGKHGGLCGTAICRAGRECAIDEDGEQKCVCVQSCPEHHSPVCSSNGKSYNNYCLMHQDACLQDTHLRVKHKGHCTNDVPKKKAHHKNKENPVVCFQSERDAFHSKVLHHFREHDTEQSWYESGMSVHEAVRARFDACDVNDDKAMDVDEFLECVKNVTLPGHHDENSELVRVLCIDAIINSGDTNSDYRLSHEEFKTIMDPAFKPKSKSCSLEGKKFHDGAETRLDCNECVCACGNWVCTASLCSEQELEDPNLFDDDEAEVKSHSGHSKNGDKIKSIHHPKELQNNHL